MFRLHVDPKRYESFNEDPRWLIRWLVEKHPQSSGYGAAVRCGEVVIQMYKDATWPVMSKVLSV